MGVLGAGRETALVCSSCKPGGASYNGLYWEAPNKRNPFSGRAKDRVSRIEVLKRNKKKCIYSEGRFKSYANIVKLLES